MTRYTDAIGTLLPTGAGEALKALATEQHQTTSSYVRQVVMEHIERMKADAGTLYTEQPDGRQWALVRGDDIRILPYSQLAPEPSEGVRVLPVVFEDSEPFDHTKHYRLAPVASLRGDVVVRTYPVVSKEGIA